MGHTIMVIAVAAVITAALRFIPFFVFGGKKEPPAYISYLGKVLPGAIMAMLVVYCLKGVSFGSVSGFAPELIASAAVVGVHIWRKNTLLSILVGTVLYMLLVQLVF
ncbi:MAG: AzlD domain-containing protein [Oscillospiraceae bacterium]|nr:AzlD domain-containing protein [Oscillospiraceae bacterium]